MGCTYTSCADVHQGGCELLANSKEIKEDEAARTRALVQLKHKLQEELWTIRGAVDTVKMQLVHVKPGPSYVAELSREIERVDVHLSSFKHWQASSMTALAEQERQLQEEMEMSVFKIEDEMAAAANAYAQHGGSGSTRSAASILQQGQGGRRPQAGVELGMWVRVGAYWVHVECMWVRTWCVDAMDAWRFGHLGTLGCMWVSQYAGCECEIGHLGVSGCAQFLVWLL
ncbi:hypothetical protein DUNSADRAFT_1697 [Dunaliella salina]|uniref:Uncharacterized protein n=1 Tax=Dunaliella salina TaxID=3046 RepID=A0ABQ7GWV6_DUNSA|nr:hypothetical protein DUNSADRAFT_1697 [Dunaliella salina]|eukprot:KAF5839080.1 hypothetical protein DUNSADRAFT_1697 [Dunaliella salina]